MEYIKTFVHLPEDDDTGTAVCMAAIGKALQTISQNKTRMFGELLEQEPMVDWSSVSDERFHSVPEDRRFVVIGDVGYCTINPNVIEVTFRYNDDADYDKYGCDAVLVPRYKILNKGTHEQKVDFVTFDCVTL